MPVHKRILGVKCQNRLWDRSWNVLHVLLLVSLQTRLLRKRRTWEFSPPSFLQIHWAYEKSSDSVYARACWKSWGMGNRWLPFSPFSPGSSRNHWKWGFVVTWMHIKSMFWFDVGQLSWEICGWLYVHELHSVYQISKDGCSLWRVFSSSEQHIRSG